MIFILVIKQRLVSILKREKVCNSLFQMLWGAFYGVFFSGDRDDWLGRFKYFNTCDEHEQMNKR